MIFEETCHIIPQQEKQNTILRGRSPKDKRDLPHETHTYTPDLETTWKVSYVLYS